PAAASPRSTPRVAFSLPPISPGTSVSSAIPIIARDRTRGRGGLSRRRALLYARAMRALTGGCAALVAAAILAGPARPAPSGLAPAAATVPRWYAWLCRPGLARNYCDTYLATTLVGFGGVRTVQDPAAQRNPPIDCFYVYPTVSLERRGNADLRIQEAEIDVV